MLKAELANIKDFIKLKNPWFNIGFSDVYADPERGILIDGKTPVFPSDNLGDYFYLRLPKNVSFGYDSLYVTTQCNRPLTINTSIILVAFMRDGDEDKLISNLINTIQQYNDRAITITGGILKAENVIYRELSILPKDIQSKALQNLDNTYTLVSIDFNFITPFQFEKLSCLTKPCRTC